MGPGEHVGMIEEPTHETSELQLALLKRSSDEFHANCSRCSRCRRTLLTGEHVHEYADRLVCELCIVFEHDPPASSRLVHGPEFGHTIRIIDQRVAA